MSKATHQRIITENNTIDEKKLMRMARYTNKVGNAQNANLETWCLFNMVI